MTPPLMYSNHHHHRWWELPNRTSVLVRAPRSRRTGGGRPRNVSPTASPRETCGLISGHPPSRARGVARARATAVPGGKLTSPAMVRSRERATRSCADLATIVVSPCRTSGRWCFRVKGRRRSAEDDTCVSDKIGSNNNIHTKLRLFAVQKREAREFPRLLSTRSSALLR